MVTVIIPAFNEQETIDKVVKFCLKDTGVNEVIVVDDQSTDDTKVKAEKAGAVVITSHKQGKGVSMKEGIAKAKSPYIVFLDADIYAYPADTIHKMVQPIKDNECDFVKGAFFRNAGKVTELVAQPLLKIFYPELASFRQPLSTMIAGKKSLLRKLDFFEDYGVDIGILIDMHLMKARVKEVNIGYIENKGKAWQTLELMTNDISNVILLRSKTGNSNKVHLDQLGAVHSILENLLNKTASEIKALRKLYLFSLDNTLVEGNFIDICAKHFNIDGELAKLKKHEKDPTSYTKRLGILLKAAPLDEMIELAESMPLVQDAIETIALLRKQGNIVGIVTNSFQVIADYFKDLFQVDFALGNQLSFFEGKATGEISIPNYFYYQLDSKCQHSLCKTNALMYAAHKFDIAVEDCVAIGSMADDVCMLEKAGMGVAFCSKHKLLKSAADVVINTAAFESLVKSDSPANTRKKKQNNLNASKTTATITPITASKTVASTSTSPAQRKLRTLSFKP